MRYGFLVLAALMPATAMAASPKGLQMWNLTPNTLNQVQLAPAGTTKFGPNQCANDKDGSVDFDERLKITKVPPGSYDLRLRDVKGRICFAHGVTVPAEGVFTVDEKALVDCVP